MSRTIPITPEYLDYSYVRIFIPHTIGEHPPNELGVLLCNGHCQWDSNTCGGPSWRCLKCEYLECHGCAEDWIYALTDLYPQFDGYGISYCRNCLVLHDGLLGAENLEEVLSTYRGRND
jgi:hypothetical protein